MVNTKNAKIKNICINRKLIDDWHDINAIIFDIDNVLVDTRQSYLNAIRWTIEIYLTTGSVPFFTSSRKAKKPEILTPDDIDRFKLLGGFNDDWDCCYGLLLYLINLPVRGRTVKDLRRAIDIRGLSKRLKKRPLRVAGIIKAFRQRRAVKIEKISRMFQEIYLGRDLYQIIERHKPTYWHKIGLIHKEKPIFRKTTLSKLIKRGVKLGIATGRSRFEAVYALKRFGILDYFNVITTIDEVKRAEREAKQSLRKPHPFSLIETAKKIGLQHRFLYIGDQPDDVLAAQAAKEKINIYSVGFPRYASDLATTMEELLRAKPDFLITKPSDINLMI